MGWTANHGEKDGIHRFYPLFSHISPRDKGHFGPFTDQKNAKQIIINEMDTNRDKCYII
jgi:hypothetical protein